MQIVIPSFRRAEAITTHRIVKNYLVCVAESEVEAYAKRIPREKIVAHPDSVVRISPTRNWILDNLPDPEKECTVMLDDDIIEMMDLTTSAGQPVQKMRSPEIVEGIIWNTYAMCKEAGAYLFGWSMVSLPAYYHELHPFRLTGFVNNVAFGLVDGHGLRFDENLPTKTDYDLSLQNALKHRIILRDTRYSFTYRPTFKGSGGASVYRNSTEEDEGVRRLKQKWGSAVRLGKKVGWGSKSGRGKTRELAGGVKVHIKLPF